MAKPSTWSAHFAQLFCEFIDAAPEESGVPLAEAMPRAHQESAALDKAPSLLVTCLPQKSDHRKMFKGQLQFRVRCDFKAGEENTFGPAAVTAIEKRLLDDDAFAAFVMLRSEEERTGWNVLRTRILTSVETAVDGKDDTRDWTLLVDLTAVVDRSQVPAD